MKILAMTLILLFAVVPAGLAASIDGGTIIVVDTSGSGNGEGVSTATDNNSLREKSVRSLLDRYREATPKTPVAVITCNDVPTILLQPTTEEGAIDHFLKGFQLSSSGGTSVSSTVNLFRTIEGRPKHVVYIGDGLLTNGILPSTRVVQQLPIELAAVYGSTPLIHVIGVDSSNSVFTRTRANWTKITHGRVVDVRYPSDIDAAASKTARALAWKRAIAPNASPKAASISLSRPAIAALAAVSLIAPAVVLLKKRKRAAPNALITIEENGEMRRASARNFGKAEVSIGDGASDIKVAAWDKPITLLQREVVDRRGRKRHQTIAQYGNRSVIVGRVPASFRNGKTTVKVRGGRS